MNDGIRLDQDWHVASTFSTGAGSVEENVRAAEAAGLSGICVVDRARRSSGWVGDLAIACSRAAAGARIAVACGIEVEVLDVRGMVELPRSAARVDHLYLATRMLPTPRGPLQPAVARERIASGALLPARAIEWLVRAWAAAAQRADSVVLAAPFALLAEIGIDIDRLHPSYLHWLVRAIAPRGVSVELDERDRCLPPAIAEYFLRAGIELRAATRSESPDRIGRYAWCGELAAQLGDVAPWRDDSPRRLSLAV